VDCLHAAHDRADDANAATRPRVLTSKSRINIGMGATRFRPSSTSAMPIFPKRFCPWGGGDHKALLRGPFERLLKKSSEEAGSPTSSSGDIARAGRKRESRPDYRCVTERGDCGLHRLRLPVRESTIRKLQKHDRKGVGERFVSPPNVLYGMASSFGGCTARVSGCGESGQASIEGRDYQPDLSNCK